MSIGDPNFNRPKLFVVPKPEKPKEQPLENLNDIPPEFFVVHRDKNSVIRDVCFSRKLSQKISVIMGMNTDDTEVIDDEIKKGIGFYSKSLNAKLMELREKYLGKTQAPLFTENEDELRIFSFEQPTEPLREIPDHWFIALKGKRTSLFRDRSVIEKVDFSPMFYEKTGIPISQHLTESDKEKVKQVTGFSMEELNNRRIELETTHKGKTKVL
jgi:hypothetical protein